MTTPSERRAFGRTVAKLRKERGLKQEELAAAVGRTASWVSQVERGVQPVHRMPVLRMLADALNVSVQTLQPDAPADARSDEHPAQQVNDLDQARLLLSGHPVPELLLNERATTRPKLPELRAAVEKVWKLAHASRYAELSEALGPLVPRLERSARIAPDATAPQVWALLGQTYQALAAAFVRQDQPDAAWVAADRAISAAERSGDGLQVFAGVFRLAQAFVRLKHLDQAEHAATTAVNALKPQAAKADARPEVLSLLGALHLALALVHGRNHDRSAAHRSIAEAREVAQRLGQDRNDFNLEFGPTNVEIQAASIAVELGDAGEAIEIGEHIDATSLSMERRARLAMDMGRAYAQRRQVGEALAHLLRAEELAADLIHTHVAARDAIRELVLISGAKASPELIALAERADAQP